MYLLTKYLLDVIVRNIYRCSSASNCALYEHKATTGMAGPSEGWESQACPALAMTQQARACLENGRTGAELLGWVLSWFGATPAGSSMML